MGASPEPSVDHMQALAAMLRAGMPQVTVYEGDVDADPVWPYLVVWGTPANPFGDRLNGHGGEAFTRTQVTVAALSPIDVLGLADRAAKALHRRRPTIPGRRCGDIEHEPGTTVPTLDPTVRGPGGQRVYITPLFFTIYSTPSPS